MQNWGVKSCLFLTPLMSSYKYAAKSSALCKPPAWHATQSFLNVKFHGKQSRLLLRLSVDLSSYLNCSEPFFFFFFFEFLHTCNVFWKFSYWIIKDLPVTVINYFLSYFTKDFILEYVPSKTWKSHISQFRLTIGRFWRNNSPRFSEKISSNSVYQYKSLT